MTDLVLLRKHIENESAMRHSEDMGCAFARCDIDCLFGGIIVRAATPSFLVAIDLCYNLLGWGDDTFVLDSWTVGRDLPNLVY